MEAPAAKAFPGRVRLAILALRISEGIYVLLALCPPVLLISVQEVQEQFPIWIAACTGVFILGFAVFIEIVVRGLDRGKFWAWVAALCISGLYIPSLFLPLGLMALIGLLDQDTRAAFGVGTKPVSNS